MNVAGALVGAYIAFIKMRAFKMSYQLFRPTRFFSAPLLAFVLYCPSPAWGGAAPIKVGALFSLSGWAQAGGQSELNAVRLAVEDINRKGGVQGRLLQLIVEDNRSSLREATTAFNKLVAEAGVQYVVGPNWAEFSEVVAPLAQQRGVVMLTPSGYTPTLTKNRPYVFSGWLKFEYQTELFAKYLLSRRHTRLALLHSANTYFEGIARTLAEQMRAGGAPFYELLAVSPEEKSFTTLVTKLSAERVDAVVVFLDESGGNATFLRTLKEQRFAGAVYGGPNIPFDHLLQQDLSPAEGVLFFDFPLQANGAFVERYLKLFPINPVPSVGRAYDLVFMLTSAIEKCGERAVEVQRCLHSISWNGVSGALRFDAEGHIERDKESAVLYRIVAGKREVVLPSEVG